MPQVSFLNAIGSPFIELQSVDSTNNYAFAQIHAGLAQHGAAFFAHSQTAGKGQRGKTWLAEKDTSLILSVVINPQPLLLNEQFRLSACVAVSACEFFQQYAGDNTTIKWPNDIYWQDRKAGGVLVENIIGKPVIGYQPSNVIGDGAKQWRWAVAGIGINLNQASFSNELKNPVSLKQITGKSFDAADLAKELCRILDKNFKNLIEKGFDEIYAAYLEHLYKRNETVKLKKGNRMFEAMIKGVSSSGLLIVQHAIEEEFNFGEVEWVIT